MTSAFGGQHSIQLSYGCSFSVARPDVKPEDHFSWPSLLGTL